MKNRFQFLQIQYFLVLLVIFSNQLISKDHVVKWKEISNAYGYVVQFKNSKGEIVLEKKTGSPKVNVDLPAGKYQFKIGVENKLGEIAGWSKWKQFNIKTFSTPQVDSKKKSLVTDGSIQKVEIEGKSLYEKTKAYILVGKDKIPVEILVDKDKKKAEVSIDTSKLKGKKKEYTLVLENPKGDPVKIKLETKKSNKSNVANVFSLQPFFRSVLLPGWGNLFIGNTTNKIIGYTYISIFTASLGLFTWRAYERYNFELDYQPRIQKLRMIGLALDSTTNLGPGVTLIYPLVKERQLNQEYAEIIKDYNNSLKLTAFIYITSLVQSFVFSFFVPESKLTFNPKTKESIRNGWQFSWKEDFGNSRTISQLPIDHYRMGVLFDLRYTHLF